MSLFDEGVFNRGYIRNTLSDAALYEQLAEECCEFAHACQKMARFLRGENPTPLTVNDIDGMIEEEYTDVMLVSNILGLNVDYDVYYKKTDRWAERLS